MAFSCNARRLRIHGAFVVKSDDTHRVRFRDETQKHQMTSYSSSASSCCSSCSSSSSSSAAATAAAAHKLERGSKTMRITWIGLWSNVILSGVKFVAGAQAGSSALIADALHSMGDVLGDTIALMTISITRNKPNMSFPYGYGKWEGIGTLAVSTLLIGGGFASAYHSFSNLSLNSLFSSDQTKETLVRELMDSVNAVSSADDTMLLGALGVAAISVAVKEALFRATVKIGRESRSSVVIANAWHHRQDALTSIAAMIGMIGTYFNYDFFDPIAGVIVSGMIIKAGGDSLIQAVSELTDRVTDENEAIIKRIEKIGKELALMNKDFLNLHDVKLRKFGDTVMVDVHAVVRPTLSVTAAFHLGQEARRTIIRQIDEVGDVFVHIDAGEDAFRSLNNERKIRPLSLLSKSNSKNIDFSKYELNVDNDAEDPSQEDAPIALSHSRIQAMIAKVVIDSNQTIIHGVSHCTIHYEDPRTAKDHKGIVPVRVEINLKFNLNVTLLEAKNAAKIVQENVLKEMPFVKAADLHVDLDI